MNILQSLFYINVGVVIVIVGIVGALVVNSVTFNSRHSLGSITEQRGVETGGRTTIEEVPFEKKESYVKRFTSKRLFRPLVKKQKRVEKVITIDDLSRDLLLIGVVKQDKPEAIIKNRRTRQTYMVKSGDAVGRLRVESVDDDTVIISFEGAKKTLFIQ